MSALRDGRRQVLAFLIPGDVIDATATPGVRSCAMVAATQLLLVCQGDDAAANEEAFKALARVDVLLAARRQEQLMRVTHPSARERTIHLFLELYDRLNRVGLSKNGMFRMPVNQEVLADALGLSVVNVNRILRELRDDGCLGINAGAVTLKNIPDLVAMSGYVRLEVGSAELGFQS